MADLLDIAPSSAVEIVRISGERVKVCGISLDAIASLVSRFPNLKGLINGGFGDDFFVRLIEGCGVAASSIIAAGCGHLGDERYEQRAAQLLPDEAMKLLKAIFGLTFPNGIGSFAEELTSLINGSEGAKPTVHKIRLKRSPSTLPLSSGVADSLPTMQ
jgi:hypothetical protein